MVPVLPSSMQQLTLHHCHDSPAAGHQGVDKILHQLKYEGYWVKMAQDVEKHC